MPALWMRRRRAEGAPEDAPSHASLEQRSAGDDLTPGNDHSARDGQQSEHGEPDRPHRSITRGHGCRHGATDGHPDVHRLHAGGGRERKLQRVRTRTHRTTTVERRLRSVYDTLDIPVDGDINPRVEAVRRYVAAAGLPSSEHEPSDGQEP
jgi:hypothetical protein